MGLMDSFVHYLYFIPFSSVRKFCTILVHILTNVSSFVKRILVKVRDL